MTGIHTEPLHTHEQVIEEQFDHRDDNACYTGIVCRRVFDPNMPAEELFGIPIMG